MSVATMSSALGCRPVQALRIEACPRQITGPSVPSALPFVVSTRRGFSSTRRQDRNLRAQTIEVIDSLTHERLHTSTCQARSR